MGIRQKIGKELAKRPRTLKKLKQKLGSDKKVARTVEEMTRQGRLVQRDGLYSVPDSQAENTVACTLVKLTSKYGFARPSANGEGDIFIPAKALAGALPGDEVLVAVKQSPRGPEGAVEAVLRPRGTFTGIVVRMDDGRLALAPDECPACPIPIRKSAAGGAVEGEKAAVEILERGASREEHRAGVAMRFGSADEAKHCVKALLYGAGLSKHFPAKVKEEAERFKDAAVTKKDLAGRIDLRAQPIFTLDGADTKDMDDAISIEKLPEGYLLGVHIADVSEYVRPGTALDGEALARGTSIYYADSVIPMLPRALSNGICSLNEGADRLAFSCLLTLSEEALVLSARFEKTVIRSRVKGVYSEVNALWDGTAGEETLVKYAPVAGELAVMREVYEKLAALRARRGALDIESGEAVLTLNEQGRCVGVERRTRGDAERMIEEFMLLANTAAASLARGAGAPFVYRVHEKPDIERVEMLKKALGAAGVAYHFAGDIPTTRELAQLLNDTRGTPLERAVHENTLRSLAKARYSPVPEGHYGLALANYAHFTSPIRRYADLAVHRILTDLRAGMDGEALQKKYARFAAEAAERASERELIAMGVERDAADCFKAEWMRPFVGLPGEEGVFTGTVSGVMPFGVYVELPNTVEGLVRIETLSHFALTLVDGVALRDEHTGRVWRLGDTMRVRAVQADVSRGRIEFEPA